VEEHVKRSEVLFTEDAVVVHMSGNRESSGRVLKVSQGLYKCFGLSKTDVVGHNVQILMPSLFAEKHNEFLDQFYKSSRQSVFNNERQLFGSNRQGYCFTLKLLLKQMPSLTEGIQYVGMIRPITTDYDYILTDIYGHIDSFSAGVG
jgi:two-component system sensor kinase FixL